MGFRVKKSVGVVTEVDPEVSSYTKGLTSANVLLTELKTVDGSGSGLDADLIRGINPNTFLTTETDPTVSNFTKSLTSNNTILTALNAASGTISASVLPSYVDDVLNFANLAAFPVAGETGKIYVTEDTNKTYRWSGSVYVEISSSATAGEALKLTNARTISTTGDATYSVSFDGSANVSSAITLANSGVTAGTYNNSATQVRPFTVDAKGRITGTGAAVDITPPWSAITGKPTTLDGFGITGGTITGHLSITGSLRGTGAGVGLIETSPLGTVAGNTQLLWTKTGFVNNIASERTWIRRRVAGTNWETVLFHNGITVDAAFQTPGVDTRAWWERDIATGSQSWGNANTTFFSADSSRFNIPLTTPSTSPTTGAITAASLGITGAIFAGTVSANSYNLIPVGRGAGGVSSNTVVGVNSLLANTTGANLTAVGVNSLLANTTGNSSTAVGLDSLRVNTSGSNLTAVGVGSLQNNTTGNSSTAVGVGALFSNATGSSLVGFGVGAGRFIADGVTGLTASSNSCFIGASTKGTQNATNENVFGFNATGNGSNTVTLGDSNITNNFFRGALSLNGTQVISTRRTGWSAPTGTATRTTFATSTVTLSELAETVKALIDDLTTHGLIGA